MKRSIVTPLLFSAILFLLIRLTNDLPMRAHYLNHSWRFILIELAGVVAGCFLCDYLARKWIVYTMKRHIGVPVEYAAVLIVPIGMCVIVMGLSHDVSPFRELPDLIIPVVITGLMSIWLYLTMKSQFLNKLYAESRLREQEAREARTEADLKLLRAQFHPHFLFNMLNTIYFTIDENNSKARDTVENLSNLLRLQLYEGGGTVPIDREVEALNSYLKLCRVRFGDTIEIIDQIDVGCRSGEIHPHLFFPLVENAVKHSGGSPRRVMVKFVRNCNSLELTVKNTMSILKAAPKEESGLGLSNLRKRLELLYPNKYNLTINENGHEYIACLKLELLSTYEKTGTDHYNRG